MRVAFVLAEPDRRGDLAGIAMAAAHGLRRRGHEVAVYLGGGAGEWPPPPDVRVVASPPLARLDEDGPAAALRAAGASLDAALGDYEVVHPYGRAALHATAGCARPRLWYCHQFAGPLPVEATHRELLAAVQRGDVDPADPAAAAVVERHAREKNWRTRWRHSKSLAEERAAVAAVAGALVSSGYGARCFRHAYGRLAEVLEPGVPEAAASGAARAGIAVLSGTRPSDNLHATLAALAEATGTGERLDLYGVPPDALRQVPAAAALGERLQARGDQPPDLAAARLCVYLPWCEPSGIPAAAALARATPVLCSDHGGGAEVATRTGGGAVADPAQPRAVAAALQQMCSDPEELRRMGQQGRQAVHALFGMEAYLDRLERALRRTAGREAAR